MGGHTDDRVSEISTQPSEAIPYASNMPQYFVDFLVKSAGGFLGTSTKFEWRQFVLTGQTLDVVHQEKREYTFNAREVSIELISSSLYRLDVNGKQQLVLSIPSASRLERFKYVLQLAAESPAWTPPTYDVLTNLFHVAKEIVETEAAQPSSIPISTVNVAQVQAHLAEMLFMYKLQGACTSMEQVYSYLLDMEADYCANVNVDNFCHTVHRLHPVQYATSAGRTQPQRRSLKDTFSTCPYVGCGEPVPIGTMYKVHMKGESVPCSRCTNMITPPSFRMAEFIADTPQFIVDPASTRVLIVDTPALPADGNVETFLDELFRRMKEQARHGRRGMTSQLRSYVSQKIKQFLNAGPFGAFEMDLVQAMIRQLDFVNKMCPNMDYWNDPVVIEASIIRYHKFMNLMKVKKHSIVLVPTSDIDLVWHTHQADTRNYYEFCKVNIGRIIDHDDTIEGGDLRKGYADTFLLWCMTYNDAYSSFAPSYVSWTSEKTNNMVNHHFLKQKWKNFGRLPSRDCRFFGVDESFAVEALPYAAAVAPDEKAVESAKEPLPEALSVYMAVIGTPVMDGRVRLQYSRHNYLMVDGGLG
ncbi:hypothetical protein AeNC1_017067, partial [Aphanomyces euteiches]